MVAFGDSITDGAYAAVNQNARWPDELARRLLANPKTAEIGVLNEGIGGNRILHDNTGPSALARFDRDVIAQAGVKYVIILEAINDIGHAYDTRPAVRYGFRRRPDRGLRADGRTRAYAWHQGLHGHADAVRGRQV